MEPNLDIKLAKQLMISQQLKPCGVNNPKILSAMEKVPREIFFEEHLHNLSYCDSKLPIGDGHESLPPSMIGKILEAVNLNERDDVLQVGIGAGYLSALCAELSFHLTAIDINKKFVEKAAHNLSSIRLSNFHMLEQDYYEYIKEKNKVFDVIIFCGSIPKITPDMIALLNPKGRLFAVIGQGRAMSACLCTKEESGNIIKKNIFDTHLAPLQALSKMSEFKF